MEKLNCIRIIRKSNQVVAAAYIKEFCKLCGFFTEDYEIECENSINLKERTGFLNLFFVLHLKHLFLVHQLIYNNIPFSGCQALFSTFFTFS